MPKPSLLNTRKWSKTLGLLQRDAAAFAIDSRDGEALLLGWLTRLWETANAADGNPVVGSAVDVEISCRWLRLPGVLFALLLECRWIDEIDPSKPDGDAFALASGTGVYAIHDYLEHCPSYLKERWRQRTWRKKNPPSPPPPPEEPKEPPAKASKAKPARETKEPFRPAAYPIPPPLDTPEFREAWAAWHAFRREDKLRTWKETTCAQWMETFLEWGPERAAACLRYTVKMTYQGPREDNSRPVRQAPVTSPAVAADSALEQAKAEATEELFLYQADGKIDEDRRDQLLEYLKDLRDVLLVKRFRVELAKEAG